MERTEVNTAEWEVATACDIRLGEFFRENSDLNNAFIDINVNSIRTVLDSYDSGGVVPQNPKLLFEVAHPDNITSDATTRAQDIRGREIIVRAENRTPVDLAHCKLRITEEELLETAKITSILSGGTEELRASGYILSTLWQTASAHDLKHVVDFFDSEIRRQEVRYTRSTIAFRLLLPLIPFKSTRQRAKRYYNNRLDSDSPFERRAYAATSFSTSHIFPEIVSIDFID